MKSRISRVVTKTGDDGTTGLADGLRISKNHTLIHVLGEIDELNSSIGLLICELKNTRNSSKLSEIKDILTSVQHQLFNLGGEISMPKLILITETQLSKITNDIGDFNEKLAPLKEFILPGGSKLSSLAHISRTVARRAERNLVALVESNFLKSSNIKDVGLPYLNRLSDLLFVIGRCLVEEDNNENIFWEKPYSKRPE